MAQPGLTMDANAKKPMPGRTPTPVSGTPAGPSPVSSKMRATGLQPAKPVSSKRSAPRPINMPLGQAVPMPQAPSVPTGIRPVSGPQTAQVQPKRRITGQYVSCSRCSMPISAEGLKQGDGELINGVPVCKTCIRKAAERQRLQRTTKLALTSVSLAAIALAIFFPSHMLFVGVIAAALAAVAGIVGFTLSGSTRAMLVGGGIICAAAGIFVLRSMSRHSESQVEHSGLAQEAHEVQELIDKGQTADAEQRLNALQTHAQDEKGRFVSGQAQSLVEETRKSLNEHVRAKHGNVDARERDVLNFLATAYPDKPGAAARFRDVKVENTTLKLSVLLNEEPQNGCVMDELKDLPFAIFEIFPKVSRIEARFISPGGADAGSIALDRDQAVAMRSRMGPTSGLPIQPQAMKAVEKPAPGAIPEHIRAKMPQNLPKEALPQNRGQ